MFKRALGADAYSLKTKAIVEADTVLTEKQKRRVLNSLLPYAVLSAEQLNEFDETSSEEENVSEHPDTNEQGSVGEPDAEEGIIYKTREGTFRACRVCPGKKMLTDEDIGKHLESKQHKKREEKSLTTNKADDSVKTINKDTAPSNRKTRRAAKRAKTIEE